MAATAHATDHHDHPPATVPAVPVDTATVRTSSIVAAVVGLATYAGCGIADGAHADWFTTYLCGFVFWFSLPVGALSLLLIAYLTSASWGIVLRSMLLAATRTLPVLALFFCPVAASLYVNGGETPSSPFWWSSHKLGHEPAAALAMEAGKPVEAIEELQHKIHDYLNPNFFVARAAVYFLVFGVLAYFVNKWAARSEATDDPAARSGLAQLCGPGVIVWALLCTFAATDWVMSVEPTWASSMFPVVFGMNMFLTAYAFSIFVFYSQATGHREVLTVVKDKFRIDIGTLLLGFTMVWAYASFSQYMLIWAGNLPEELTYYSKRGNGGWEWLAYFLMAFHWLVPFVVLLFREVKTHPTRIRVMCVLLVAVCMADVIWWILPAALNRESHLHVPMAVGAIVGLGGVWGLWYARELGKQTVLATNADGKFLANWGAHH